MAWYEITTAEIAPRQPLDAELFKKIRSNFIVGISAIGLPQVIPNGSFEYSTGTVPSLWTISSFTGGSASISTGAHGANSLKITHPGTAAGANYGGAAVYTDDFIAVGGTAISIQGIFWASNTAVKGGLAWRSYDKDQTIIATGATNHSSYTSTPTTIAILCTYTTDTRFIKVGCFSGTDGTAAGSLYFDGLYIYNT